MDDAGDEEEWEEAVLARTPTTRDDEQPSQAQKALAAPVGEIEKGFGKFRTPFQFNPGNDLLSHRVTPAVSSAREGLTAVFGMGTGVSPPPLSPEN